MNEIKYRAWSKKDKKMFSWESIERTKIFAIEPKLDPCKFILLPTDENIELMLYTGKEDDFGIEIYEGDIIEYNWSDEQDGGHEISPVEWSLACTGFYPFINEIRWRYDLENVKIIGNIYEHPELVRKI
jgi:hypothetical protein